MRFSILNGVIMKFKIGILLVVFLAGCATAEKFNTKMNGFVGQPEIAVASIYGPPQSVYSLPDGQRVISYTRGGQMVLPGVTTTQPVTTNTRGNLTLNQGLNQTTGIYSQQSTTYVQQQTPSTTVNLSCTVNFTIDAQGVIRSWSATGNRCVAE